MSDLRSAVVALHDLMFRVKIDDALKRSHFKPVFVASGEEALRETELAPALVVLDLNDTVLRPLELIPQLRRLIDGMPRAKRPHLLAYVSHVQTDLRQEAAALGCDEVVARSSLVQTLGKLQNPASPEGDLGALFEGKS